RGRARLARRAAVGGRRAHRARRRRHSRRRAHARRAREGARGAQRRAPLQGRIRGEGACAARRSAERRFRGHARSRRLRLRLRHGLSRLLARMAGALGRRIGRDGARSMSGKLGLIVGSGASALGLEVVARAPTHTPYGAPSSPILTSEIAGRRIVWIARHGEEGGIAPHEINYRANLWALYQHGVRQCVGINVVGAIEEGFSPGDIAVPEQLIDYTWGRESTFGGRDGRVLHAEFAEPFSRTLTARLVEAARESGYDVRRGVYGVTQGPRLETIAEIARM